MTTHHQSESNAQPASETVDVCVDSNQDVIRKFCDLESRVWRAVIDSINPRDCFCGHGQGLTVSPVLRFEDGYRHNLAAFRFIEAAAMKAVEEFQTMQQRHKSEADEFAAQPASEPARAAVEWEYRKRPIVVKASQWWRNGDHPEDNCDMFDYPDAQGNVFQRPGEGKVVRYFRRPDVPSDQPCKHCTRPMNDHGWIDTLEGGHIVCPGDYVITGVKGERYPCKPDIFTATYEPVAPAQPPASEPSGREESLNCLEARLAADIRAIDGNHDKGAAELAEQLIARGWHPALSGEREEVEQKLRGGWFMAARKFSDDNNRLRESRRPRSLTHRIAGQARCGRGAGGEVEGSSRVAANPCRRTRSRPGGVSFGAEGRRTINGEIGKDWTMDKHAIEAAIHATVAREILNGLDTEARDALLQKSITDALTDYSFRKSVGDVVSAKAAQIAAELVETDEWQAAIREHIKGGFDKYLAQLDQGMLKGFKRLLHGNSSGNSYDRNPALILSDWPE
jgi:hypothetical protein